MADAGATVGGHVIAVGAEGDVDARVRRSERQVFTLLVTIVGIVWIGLGRLAIAFLRGSLDWEYVAEQSRVGAPWYYRLAGVWGGMEGSLLLFAGIVGVAAVVAARRAGVAARGGAVATIVILAGTDLLLASPFGRLDVPATVGFGMNPILEHPAMAIHPPLLYGGLAASGAAALAAAGATDPWRAARRWLLTSIAMLTAAMTLGAAWSYMEQGWGGYWAWDPVENTSLLVWMAALVAVHLAPRSRPAVALGATLAPWVIALLGGALVRSGRTPSVHGFAEQLGVGRAMVALAVATGSASAWLVARRRGAAVRSDARDPRRVMVLLMTVALAVVVVGTVTPVLYDTFGGRATAVGGEFYARTVGPLAIAAVPFLLLRLRQARRGWSTVAHGGVLVLLAGIGVSTVDDVATFGLGQGDERRAAGVDVRNDGVVTGAGPREGTDAVTATVVIDGHELRPRIVVYPERGGRLAEVAVHTGPITDVHVTLETASDTGSIVVSVHRRHGMWLVWLGALVVTVATLGAARGRARVGSGAASGRPRSQTGNWVAPVPDAGPRPPRQRNGAQAAQTED